MLRGYEMSDVDRAMNYVLDIGLQSDRRFAEHKARAAEPRHGDLKITFGLRSKGIEKGLAAQVVGELRPEMERAEVVAQRFQAKLERRGVSAIDKWKLYRHLGGRGFSSLSSRVACTVIHRERGEE